jgi:hypothetical protein
MREMMKKPIADIPGGDGTVEVGAYNQAVVYLRIWRHIRFSLLVLTL